MARSWNYLISIPVHRLIGFCRDTKNDGDDLQNQKNTIDLFGGTEILPDFFGIRNFVSLCEVFEGLFFPGEVKKNVD